MKKKLTALAIVLILGAVFFYFLPLKPKKKVDLLITNGHVLTMNVSLSEYNPGWVAVKDGKIVDLGSGQPNYQAAKIIDARGQVVMPGLINTHAHTGMTNLTGTGEGLPLEEWLKVIEAKEAQLTPEDVYQGSKAAIAKMLATGTTTFNDMYFDPEMTAKEVKESGIRAIIRIPITQENGQLKFDESIVKNNQNPNLTFSVDPNPFLDFSPDKLKQVSDYALAKNLLVHIHFDEDAQTRAEALKKYNFTPYEILEKSGLVRNQLLLAHAGDINDDEINQLTKYPYGQIGMSFNPMSEYNLHTPLTPVEKLNDRKIIFGLGTDGAPSSDLDMFTQMRFAGEHTRLTARAIVYSATWSAAKALNMGDQNGSLEKDKFADIIIVNQKDQGDIYKALVYNTNGGQVTHTIINGKILK